MTFGQRLAEQREAAGLTQSQLGEGLGTDGKDAGKSVVLGWEKDRHFPRVDQLLLICAKLGCSAEYLLTGALPSWPFRIEIRRFLALSVEDRAYVEGKLESAIESREAADTFTQPAAAHPYTAQGIPGKTDSPVQKGRAFLESLQRLERDPRATRKAVGTSKSGRKNRPKGAA